jgi:anti-sigma factor RsiW
MSCESYRDLIDAYLDDSLDEVRRTGLRAHLRSCADCRDIVVRREPTMALVLGAGTPVDEARVEACVTAVMSGIRRERLERRLRPSHTPWFAAAAAVVIAVFAAGWWWQTQGEPAAPAGLQAEAVVEADTETAAESTAEPRVEPPRVEVDMTEEEVRVYRYAIGGDESTGAIFIVNPAMEL